MSILLFVVLVRVATVRDDKIMFVDEFAHDAHGVAHDPVIAPRLAESHDETGRISALRDEIVEKDNRIAELERRLAQAQIQEQAATHLRKQVAVLEQKLTGTSYVSGDPEEVRISESLGHGLNDDRTKAQSVPDNDFRSLFYPDSSPFWDHVGMLIGEGFAQIAKESQETGNVSSMLAVREHLKSEVKVSDEYAHERMLHKTLQRCERHFNPELAAKLKQYREQYTSMFEAPKKELIDEVDRAFGTDPDQLTWLKTKMKWSVAYSIIPPPISIPPPAPTIGMVCAPLPECLPQLKYLLNVMFLISKASVVYVRKYVDLMFTVMTPEEKVKQEQFERDWLQGNADDRHIGQRILSMLSAADPRGAHRFLGSWWKSYSNAYGGPSAAEKRQAKQSADKKAQQLAVEAAAKEAELEEKEKSVITESLEGFMLAVTSAWADVPDECKTILRITGAFGLKIPTFGLSLIPQNFADLKTKFATCADSLFVEERADAQAQE